MVMSLFTRDVVTADRGPSSIKPQVLWSLPHNNKAQLKEAQSSPVTEAKYLVFQVLRQLLYHVCSKANFTIFLPV